MTRAAEITDLHQTSPRREEQVPRLDISVDYLKIMQILKI